MKFWIHQKLFGGFVVIILIFTGNCLLGLYYVHVLVGTTKLIQEHPMVVYRSSQDIEVLCVAIQRNMYRISYSRDTIEVKNLIQEIRAKEYQVWKLFSLMQKQILGTQGKVLALNTHIHFLQWKGIRNDVISLARNKKYEKAQIINVTAGDSIVRQLQSELDRIADYATNRVKLFTEQSVQLGTNARLIGIISIILSILIGLFISLYLSLSITKRLRMISDATTKMAKGELKQTIEIKGDDELTQVADNFNIMASDIAGMYEDMEKKVIERTSELKEANDELLKMKSALEIKVNERTKDLEEKISELNRSQLAMLYMIEDMNETSRQLKATQEELIRKERFAILGEFSGNISHELRNPLGVIDSSIYYLQMRLTDKDEKVHQHLDRISSSVKGATTIIENLLNLTRMNNPILIRYNLTSLLNDCIETCIIPDTVKVIKEFSEKEILIKAEKEQMRMAIDNLIKNAVSAMNEIGTLTIMTSTTENMEAEISFLDTGTGINPDHLNQVFLPLFTTKAKGIGLGLSITKMIVENHKGKISVTAEPGKGAKFIIRIPIFTKGSTESSIKKSIQDN
jgi:signal transduction histidine kinase